MLKRLRPILIYVALIAVEFALLSSLSWRPVEAAGSLSCDGGLSVGADVTRYRCTWVSSAGGAVSGTALTLKAGSLIQAELTPDSGGTQPSDQYDLTILDTNGVDVLAGAGANLSNAASAMVVGTSVWIDQGGSLTITIANAGSAKGGTVVLWLSGHAG